MGEQAGYQVRFDWGLDGLQALEPPDVVVWVDEVDPVRPLAPPGGLTAIVLADLQAAPAVAAWILDLQQALRRRLAIGVVAAGSARADGSRRWDVEDLLAAGAVISQLAALGIDACSPEAAAAEAAYRALGGAVGHLVSASVSGRRAGAVPSEHRLGQSTVLLAAQVLSEHPEREALTHPSA